MVEKLSKALEGLKSIQFTSAIEDTSLGKKEKMLTCALVADLMASLKFTNAQNVPQLVGIVVESLIRMCDDKDSDVRMVADESLNKIIRALPESNMLKVQIELHKEIKKNGPARCLRAAMWRFGELSCYIKPSKGKGFVDNLMPCIIQITKREEESVHETLATFIETTFRDLGVFIQDNDLRALLKAFFHNLSSNNFVIRRTSASCINSTVKYCRKPHVFNSYILNTLVDSLVPVNEDTSSYLVLGVLGCLRLLLPNLCCDKDDEGITGSFGLRQKKDDSPFSVDRLIQIYELCLHYSKSKDHNVVTASLETLNQLLQNPTQKFESLLMSSRGFTRSYIHSTRENKMRSRSGSEMSVAGSVQAPDESSLLDDSEVSFDLRSALATSYATPDAKPPTSKPLPKPDSSEDDIKMVDNPFKDKLLGEIFEDQSTIGLDSDAESLAPSEMNASSSLIIETDEADAKMGQPHEPKTFSRASSRDELYSNADDDTFCHEMNVDIGHFTDEDVPLVHCARHLAAHFLLDGSPESLKTDRSVRVSIKSLALSCMCSIIKLNPIILRMDLAKNTSQGLPSQGMRDILLLSDHSDPQIRGHVCLVVSTFISSVFLESKGFDCDWVKEDEGCLSLSNLWSILLKGLKDESSTCSRQALSGVKTCLTPTLFSVYPETILPILHHLPQLGNSSYWLLKVKLLEVLSELPFVCLNDLTGSNLYQDEVLDTVMFPLLGDEDPRVRTAAAESLAKAIPRLYYGTSTLLVFSKEFTNQLRKCLRSARKETAAAAAIPSGQLNSFPPFSHVVGGAAAAEEFDMNVEGSLSRIVAKLTYSLMSAVNKNYILGCVEALKVLSERYPPTVYVHGWNVSRMQSDSDGESGLTSNLVTVVLSLLVSSPVVLDLSTLCNATAALGNLFAGHCISNMRSNYQVTLPSPADEPMKYWSTLRNKQLSLLAENIFTHVMKVLNIYNQLLDMPLAKATVSATTATNLLPISLTSPIKKQEKKGDREERLDDRKQRNAGGSYKQSPQYTKLHQLLKNAHHNYKVSLDPAVSEKFLAFLESTIHVLCILLEVGSVHDTGRCAEEILSYLRSAVSLRPNASVACVIQLLKSLFGTNLASCWEETKTEESDPVGGSLFANVYQLPSEFLFNRISRHSISKTLEYESLTGLKRRFDRKIVIQNADKSCLATYIPLFEQMVIKSLRLYTITNDVVLQSSVLQLLNQLIQLRVNYRLVDADEVFVGFLLKQFELIEHGQIPGVEKLLPEMFKFLVMLSYEKHHSRPIMSVPKILQLCDVLMASNQSTQTHCIPALVPVVEDVFLSRNLISSPEQKELETQREVVLAMLLRLVEFHEVMNMLTMILNENRTVEERERWKHWSRQIMDVVLPLAMQDKLRTETFEGQESFSKLMSSLSPNVLRPIDPLLKALFVEPSDYTCSLSLKRWLSRVTVIFETILHVKEDVLLCRLQEVSPNIDLSGFLPPRNVQPDDPFNVGCIFAKYEPSETFARFLLKIVSVTGFKVLESVSTSYHFQQQLSVFFLCVFHMLKSGTFHRVSGSLRSLLTTETELATEMCSMYVRMINFAPMLTCQFSYFLALLNYFDPGYWKRILNNGSNLSSGLTMCCGIISLSDYLCDVLSDTDTLELLLSNSVRQVVLLSHEVPIKELIATLHKRPESRLLLGAISSAPIDASVPEYAERLLRILEMAHNCHSGFVLSLLMEKFIDSPYLSVSRLASLLACRRAEFLLTQAPDEVRRHLDKSRLTDMMRSVTDKKLLKRHYTLVGLLNKLSSEVYDVPGVEAAHARVVDATHLKTIQLDSDWYFTLVKERCCLERTGPEASHLLWCLTYDRIIQIMSSPEFDTLLLKDCLLFADFMRRKNSIDAHDDSSQTSSILSDPLFKASMAVTLKSVRDAVEGLNSKVDAPNGFGSAMDDLTRAKLRKLTPSVTILMNTLSLEKCDVQEEFVESLLGFGLGCLEIIERSVKCDGGRVNQETVDSGLACSASLIANRQIAQSLSRESNRSKLKSLIRSTYSVVESLTPQRKLFNRSDPRREEYAYEELKLVHQLLTFVLRGTFETLLPSYLRATVRDLIKSMCRIPEVSGHILKVPEDCDMQEIETLENFISVFYTVHWNSRQQFEEIWVGLLTVLGFNSESSVSVEESTLVVQTSTAAVEGITTLLKNTMCRPATRKILHHGRDSSTAKSYIDNVPTLINLSPDNQFGDKSYHFMDNLEIPKLTDRYFHGLLSVEYIWTTVKRITNKIELHESHTDYINEIGLDLTSCVHLLMELYNQWIYQPSPDIRIVTSCLKSSIVISDLFTDIAQFQWLLEFCLHIEHVVIAENVVILPLIIIGCSKAVSIVLPDLEMCERIKRLMLHSSSLPCRIATIQGLLYLLQSPVVSLATTRPQRQRIAKSEDEINFVTNIVDVFLPVAIDVVQNFQHEIFPLNEEYEQCAWSLVFYLLQHYQLRLREIREEMLGYVLVELSKRTCSESILALLVRGVERLLLSSVIGESFKEQISKIALDMTAQSSVTVSRCGLQLLLVLSFLEKRAKDIRLMVTGQDDPEKIMKDMEKINVLFEKLRRSYPDEAEVVGEVISYILIDFTPSDVLTKVIQEFLSSHQPHLKILSGLLFKVFERADLSLLEDWVVFSLPSFIQGLPVAMSVWTLNCFFVSASNNTWLRSVFPLVQSRLRMADPEDRELLCLCASHFYKQLKDEEQKKQFVETFQKAAKAHSVYSDLLASL